MRSAAVKEGADGGGAGVGAGGARPPPEEAMAEGAEGGTAAWPPCGEGNCEVLATSPTATQVLQERLACSKRG